MSQQEFVEVLEADLRLRGVPFDRAQSLSFVSSARPLIAENPEVAFWGGEFLKAGNVAWA
jgi:hypothetical protein